MSTLLVTLPLGLLLELGLFLLLKLLLRMDGRQAAIIAAVTALGAYLALVLPLATPGADEIAIHVALYGIAGYILAIVSHRRAAPDSRGWHWAPAVIVGFFLFVVSVDAVFVTVATNGLPEFARDWILPEKEGRGEVQTSFPGLLQEHYYQREHEYNEFLRQFESQKARGWKVRKGWLSDHPRAGRPELFRLAIEEREGRPVSGAEIVGLFERTSSSALDQEFTMAEIGPGLYQTNLTLPEPGEWRVKIIIRKDDYLHQIRAATRIYD